MQAKNQVPKRQESYGLPARVASLASMAFYFIVFSTLLYFLTQGNHHFQGLVSGYMAKIGRPNGWQKLIYILMPFGLFLSTLTCNLLTNRPEASSPNEKKLLSRISCSPIDLVAIAFLALVCVLVFFAGRLSNWPVYLGAIYIIAISIILGVSIYRLWKLPEKSSRGNTYLTAALLGIIFCVYYIAVSFWTNFAVSTAGDEPAYLLSAAHSWNKSWLGGFLPLKSNISSFYWGRWSPSMAEMVQRSPLFPWLIAPFLLLGGRIGVFALFAVVGGLSLAIFYILGKRLGYSREAVLAAAALLGYSLPLMQLTQHVYPAIFSVLACLLGLLILSANNDTSKITKYIFVCLLAFTITIIKFRYMPLGAALAICTVYISFGKRTKNEIDRIIGVLLIVTMIIFVLSYMTDKSAQRALLITPINKLLSGMGGAISYIHVWPMFLAALALLFDQEFGLFFYAPWLILGVMGFAMFYKSHRDLAKSFITIYACTVGSLLIWRWMQWYGGFTPPTRFLAPIIPLAALAALPIIERATTAPRRTLILCLATLSGLIAILLTIFPIWKYHRGHTTNRLFEIYAQLVNIDISNLFPSFIFYDFNETIPVVFWAALILALGIPFYYRHQKPKEGSQFKIGDLFTPKSFITAASVLLGGLVLASAMAALIPKCSYQAVAFNKNNVITYGDTYPEGKHLIFNRKGGEIWKKLYWSNKFKAIRFTGKWLLVNRGEVKKRTHPPLLSVYLGGKKIGDVEIGREWSSYSLPVESPSGLKKLAFVYTRQPGGRDQVVLTRMDFLTKSNSNK